MIVATCKIGHGMLVQRCVREHRNRPWGMSWREEVSDSELPSLSTFLYVVQTVAVNLADFVRTGMSM